MYARRPRSAPSVLLRVVRRVLWRAARQAAAAAIAFCCVSAGCSESSLQWSPKMLRSAPSASHRVKCYTQVPYYQR